MKIAETKITVRDLTSGYKDNSEAGVVGYDGKLDIRPPYQREFIYKDAQRNAVINTVMKDYPLNVMYWADLGKGKFETIDGQQRTISLCQFVTGDFSIDVDGNAKYFHTLQTNEQDQILNYELTVYKCVGTPSEKLAWFEIINMAGERLTPQELLNSSYQGTWLADAKRYFSKSGCAAYGLGKDYVEGSPIRQEYLETAINWISNGDISGYMAKHQNDPNVNELWDYFQAVIKWIKTTFPTYRKEMKSINWGVLYNTYKDGLPNSASSDPAKSKIKLNPVKLEDEIGRLMEDEDVSNKKGIYSYVLSRKENKLNIRAFTDKQKREAFEHQKGSCLTCKKTFKLGEMQADHIIPWSKGGKTISANLQMLCDACNRTKSGK